MHVSYLEYDNLVMDCGKQLINICTVCTTVMLTALFLHLMVTVASWSLTSLYVSAHLLIRGCEPLCICYTLCPALDSVNKNLYFPFAPHQLS